MQGSLAMWLSALALALAATDAASATVTPVQKVIELLNGMVEKGKQEKHEEQVAFGKFKVFCGLTREQKEKTIAEAANSISSLEADIAKAEADAEKLGGEIAGLDTDLAKWASEKAKATELREKERSEYDANYNDYSESIDALERAISTLKAKSEDVPMSLVELQHLAAADGSKSELPARARQALSSVLQVGSAAEQAELGAPAVAAYEFQSSGVINMLEKLRHRFIEERRTLEKEETNTRHSYQLVMQKIEDDAKYATETRAKKTAAKAGRLSDAAEAKGDLAETREGKAADESYLQDLTADCHSKSHEFEERQTLRARELEAIQKAIEIISSPTVAGAAKKHLPAALLQRSGARVLVQLRDAGAALRVPVQARASSFLSQRAARARSALLAAVASRAARDPFAKVKQMIKDLLVRLMEEANEEADHKGWCDAELAASKLTRDNLSAEVEALTSKVDELSALEAKLASEVSDLSDAIAAIEAAVAQATAQRTEEKATNTATIAEAAAAQAAVTQATKVLKDFYGTAADATALLQRGARQTPGEDAPATWGSPYKGMQSEKGGIFGMLEVIQSDFARLQSKTETSEEEAQREFVEFTHQSESDKAVKDKEMRHKGFAKDRATRDLRQSKKDLITAQKELDTALAYFEKLKPSCVNLGTTYEGRKKHREEEIQSLQEALAILNGNDLAAPPEDGPK